MAKKPSWDDIPSLNLELDDGYDEKESSDRRTAVRLTAKELIQMLIDKPRAIYVQVAVGREVLKQKGTLRNISQEGMNFILPGHGLQKNNAVRIGVMLGKRPFQTGAVVCWVDNDQVGIRYVNPKPEDVAFLAELYSAKKLTNY